MMRLMLTCLVLVLALAVSGCTGAGGGGGYLPIPFEKVEPGQEPARVARGLELIRERGGSTVMVDEGVTYAIVTLGMQSSGGWDVTVESVGESGGKIEVVYRTTSPTPGSNQTTAITYPMVVVKFTNPGKLPVQFKEAK